MKIAVNRCYGGFGLSPLAIMETAKLQGKECYFFEGSALQHYTPLSTEEALENRSHFITAFDIPNPNEVIFSEKDYKKRNELYTKHELAHKYNDYEMRTDKILIQAIKNVGESEASAPLASIDIVEIPDGIEWEIDEYDGVETVHEKHRSW